MGINQRLGRACSEASHWIIYRWQLQLFLNLKQTHVQDNITLQSEKQELNSAFTQWSHRLHTDKWFLVSFSFNNPVFRIINVNTKHSQALRKFKLKISICAPTLKNCVVELFTAVSVPARGTQSPNEWRRFTASYRLPSKSARFLPESRELNRESSVSLSSASVAFIQRSLFNWWTLSGLRVRGELFVVCLCSFLGINLCPF